MLLTTVIRGRAGLLRLHLSALAAGGLLLAGCSNSITGMDDSSLHDIPGPRIHFEKLNCDVPEPDPECGATGGDGGSGPRSMNYTAPPLVMGPYAQFPYSYIGSSSVTYQMQVMITGNGTITGDAKWGSTVVTTFNVSNGDSFNIVTTGGAGSPQIRGKSSLPTNALAAIFTCNSCS